MGGGGGDTVTRQELDPEIKNFMTGPQGFMPRALWQSQRPVKQYQGPTVARQNQMQLTGARNLIDAGYRQRDLAGRGQTAINRMLQGQNSSINLALRPARQGSKTVSRFAKTGFMGRPNIPKTNILGFANANPTLLRMMQGDPSSNPFLGQMANAAQTSTLRGFEDLAQQGSRAFQSNILPQIQQAQSLIPQAVRSFQEQILPSIRRNAQAGGTFGGSRQGLAEGLAASRLGESLSGTLGNLAQTAQISGNQTMQDILRNQSRAGRDLSEQQGNFFGSAFENAQQRALGAANTAAGLQSTAQGALVSDAGLRGNLLNAAQNRALQAGQFGLTNLQNANQLGLQQQQVALGAMPSVGNMFSSLGQAQLGIGAQRQALQQQQMLDQQRRFNFIQNEPRQRLQQFASLVNPTLGLGGSQVQQAPGANPFASALGGGIAGSAFGPWGALGGAALGGLGAIF